jgi:PelA/Pel-15E family pectate lyase
LPNPDAEIIQSIESAVKWLNESKIENLRIENIQISKDAYPGQNLSIDRKVVIDSTSKPIWARFYEISDNTPIFCTRNGKKVSTLAEVNPERRGGYAWYGYWPQELLSTEYPAWKKKLNSNSE